MDIFTEVAMVSTVNARTYRLSIPWSAPYQELHTVIKEFEIRAREMEEAAKMIAHQQAEKGDTAS